MIIPDANLLLYAYDEESPWHEIAQSWWEDLLTGNEPVGLCAPVVFAFIRVGTRPRVYTHPMPLKTAIRHVETWLERNNVRFLAFEKMDMPVALCLLGGTKGSMATDVQIAAIALRNNATVHTADSDFASFPNLSWHNPLESRKP